MNRLFFYLLLVFVFAPITTLGQIAIEPDRAFVPIEKGKSETITFTLKSGGTSMVPKADTFNDTELDFKKESSTGTTVTYKFTGKNSLPIKREYVLGFTVDGSTDQESSVKISVIDPSKFTFDVAAITDAVQGTDKQIRMTAPNFTFDPDDVKIDGFGTNSQPTHNNRIITIKPSVKGKFSLNVKVYGIKVGTIPIDVADGVKSLEVNSPITLKQGAQINPAGLGIKLLAVDGADLTATKCATPVITPDDTGIIPDPANAGKFKVNPEKRLDTGFSIACGGKSQPVKVKVEPAPTTISFSPPVASIQINTKTLIDATVRGTDNEEIKGDEGRVVWTFEDESVATGVAGGKKAADYAALVELNPDGNRIRPTLRSQPGDNKPIYVFAKSVYGTAKEKILLMPEKEYDVTDFTMIKIDLEVMEDKTTKDNFGQQLMKNYFVTKATLHNTARDDKGVYYNSPILVYNQSIEAKTLIAYEDPDTGKWITASQEQMIPTIKRTNTNAESDFRTEWARVLTGLNKTNTTDFLSIPTRVADLKKCAIREQIDYMYPYQPMKYETALLSHESRENTSWKHRILTTLLSLSSLTSFVTNIVGAGGDWPLGQTQFSNLMIPSYQKYFPDRREIHKDHLIQQLMQPLLEIPFGGQESKYLLFPRSPINVSMSLRHWNETTAKWEIKTIKKIKIIGISPSDTCANVAVIKKTP